MEKNKLSQLGLLISAFFIILIGVVLTQIIGNANYQSNLLSTYTNYSITLSVGTAQCTQVATGCIDSITSVRNLSNAMPSTNFSTVPCRGSSGNRDSISILGGANTGLWNVTYQYSPDCTYISDGASRTLMNLNTLWFALSILLIGVAIYMKIKEDYF